jgi:hypothetical protein
VDRATIIVTWHQSHGGPTCAGLDWHRSCSRTVCGGCSAAPSRASACVSCATRHAGSSPHAPAWQDDARVEDVSHEEPGMPRRLLIRISHFSFAHDILRLRIRGSEKKNGLRHCVPRCSYSELRAKNNDAFTRHCWQSIDNAKRQRGQLPVGRELRFEDAHGALRSLWLGGLRMLDSSKWYWPTIPSFDVGTGIPHDALSVNITWEGRHSASSMYTWGRRDIRSTLVRRSCSTGRPRG